MRHLLLLLSLLLAGFSAAQPAALPPGAPLVVATYAYGGSDRLAHITPLATHLAAALNRPVRVRSYPSVPALLAAVRAGQVDVALLNTLGYLLLQMDAQPAVQPLAAMQRLVDGPAPPASYQACLVAHRRTGLTGLANLAARPGGLRLSFANAHSTSGHVVPRLQLCALGLTKLESQVREVRYAGTHAAVLQELLQGRADVGACGLDEYQRLQVQGQAADLQLLWTSPAIPLGPVVARRQLAPQERQRLQQVLLSLHQTAPTAFAQVRAGWVEAKRAERFKPVDDSAYQALYQLADDTDTRVHNLPGHAEALRNILQGLVQ